MANMSETQPSDKMSSAHRVLSIPTILSEIFSFILLDDDSWNACPNIDDPTLTWDDHYCSECKTYYSHGVLLRCALVNKYWFSEAIRVMWRKPFAFVHDASTTLSAHMARIAPARRQLYADWIVIGTEYAMSSPDEQQHKALEHLSFPRLRKMKMALNGGCLPAMRADKVEKVNMDPRYEACYPEVFGVTQDEMEAVFDTVAVSFPNARTVQIEDRCLVHVGGVEKFRAKMSRLEEFDSRMVTETEEDGWTLATWEGR